MANYKLYVVVLVVALVVPQGSMARKLPTKALAPTSTNNVVVHNANAPAPKNGVVDKKCIVGGWAGMGGFAGGVIPILGGVAGGGVGAGSGVGGVTGLGGLGGGAGGLGGVGGVGGGIIKP